MVQVSVIIPNLNSPHIDQTLDALRAQHFDRAAVEVLVVGQDGPGLVKSDELVRHVDPGKPTGAAFNRNLGMRAARGAVFCFTDADCVPAPDWLAQMTGALAAPGVHVVGGGVVFDVGNYWATCDNVSWFYQFLADAPPGKRAHLPTLNLAVARPVVDTVGPIDEGYPLAAGEDTEWTERMAARGFELHFAPQAVVRHLAHRATLGAMWRHGYQYGRFSSKVGHPRGGVTRSTRPLPRWLRRRALLWAASPVLAGAATLRALAGARRADSWRIGPGIWLSKLAWCLGAAQALR